MRRGARDAADPAAACWPRSSKINSRDVLPPGVQIERIYDRSALVDITTHTVLHNMVMGVVLIFLIQWLFLGDLRSALIVAATIPFALLFAVVILVLKRRIGEPAVDGRDRLRHHRRRHRDHGREHLPPPRRARPSAEPRQPGGRQDARHDLHRLDRGDAGDLLLGHHHHRGLPAAVHPVGRRGPHLRPDGQDLRLRAGRRPARHLHRLAGALGAAAARARWRMPRPAIVRALARFYGRVRDCVLPRRATTALAPALGGRAGRGPGAAARSASSSCPSSRKATCGSAPPCRRRSRSRPATTTPTACAS